MKTLETHCYLTGSSERRGVARVSRKTIHVLVLSIIALTIPSVSHAWDPIKDLTGKRLDQHLKRGAKDLKNLPGSWSRCARNPASCARETVKRLPHAALMPIIERYKHYLHNQAKGRWQALPETFIRAAQPHYRGINLRHVRYATGINTKHGQALTWHYRIFFPQRSVNLRSPADIRLMLHEIEHTGQYQRRGGDRPFLSEYILKAAGKVIQKRSFNVHDSIDIERAAIRKATSLWRMIWQAMNNKPLNLHSQPNSSPWISRTPIMTPIYRPTVPPRMPSAQHGHSGYRPPVTSGRRILRPYRVMTPYGIQTIWR